MPTVDSEVITPYSTVTHATIEVHPQSSSNSADALPDVSTQHLPRLSVPNLVVQQPTEYFEAPPQLPPPRCDQLQQVTRDGWEMCYNDLTLREAVGWGNFGLVLLGILHKVGHSHKAVLLPATSESGQDCSRQPKLVAVKRLRGELIHWIMVYMHGSIYS